MDLRVIGVGAVSLFMSAVMTGVVRRFALTYGVIVVFNARSSHHTPTPRGGGISIVTTATVALAVLSALGLLRQDLLIALAGGGVAVAIIGFIDDRWPLPVRIRFAV